MGLISQAGKALACLVFAGKTKPHIVEHGPEAERRRQCGQVGRGAREGIGQEVGSHIRTLREAENPVRSR